MIAPKEPAAETLTQLQPSSSAWSPFRHATFAVLWMATVVSNVGSWMYNAAAGWLMTDLNPTRSSSRWCRWRPPCRCSCSRSRPARLPTSSTGASF